MTAAPAAPLKFDEINYWSELKLEIIEKYGAAYAKILGATRLKKFYIDGFSGAGVHLSKKTKQQIEGSPARALRISPPFDRYYFIDLNPKKTKYLEKLCAGRSAIQYKDYMNAIWHTPENARQDGIERMNRFWGDESWRQAAYVENPQQNLFGDAGVVKQDNDAVVEAFQKRLKEVAGFKFVPDPLPMRNRNNAVVYYLFFASVAEDIITAIFKKYRGKL